MGISYKNSGVDLRAAEDSTKKIGGLADATFNQHVLNGIGLFAGFYQIDLEKYPNPVVVTSIDGVGTKLKIAFALGIHDTVGQDLVNHCVNDIMTSGADPVAFTDYIGTVDLKPSTIEHIVRGMTTACKQNDCALIGGETAEMPGFYSPGEYDIAGSIIGLVNQENIINGEKIKSKDILIGIPSNGLHTNGYSLARKVILEHKKIDLKAYDSDLGMSWGEALLQIHKSYRHAIRLVRNHPGLHGISHITGGGIVGNTKRLLRGKTLNIDWQAWDVPSIFKMLQQYGEISDKEMRRTFNLGIGLVCVVDPGHSEGIFDILKSNHQEPVYIGEIK
ncbi:MAG: phosphoribosylformylglycinamidine cyclo-ligase [candidate division KSB1 bacterium]|nr:phosphoribosylformylglycinamidine cyclo-ligase [candidate division KSB1 bacterium]